MFDNKKKSPFAELKKMREEVFIDLSSIKVAPYTLNRKIIVNTI